jgi:integrase/recombinase XerD
LAQPVVRGRRLRTIVSGQQAHGRPSWAQAVEAFLAEGRRSNLSVSTLENYRSYLLGPRTRQFLIDHEVTEPGQLTPSALKDFERELFEAGVSAGTVATFHRVFKNFAGFCIREGYAADTGVRDVKAPKLSQVEPETFSPAEEKRLLAAAKTPRDQMLVEFMLRTGLRLSEVCGVTVDDIVESPQGFYVRVRQGKGRKDRIVPLDTADYRLSAKLQRFIGKVRPRDTAEPALFLASRRDRSGRGDFTPLSPRGLQILLRRLGEETGIRVHPHKFRHTFATRALTAGVDVMALQKALGHTTLAMVSRYVHYQKDDLLAAWRSRRD